MNKSEILNTTGMVWPVSSGKWKAPLDSLSCPQIWNIEKEKDREIENIGDRLAKLLEKKSNRELKRDIKTKGDEFRWKKNLKILYWWRENEKC